MNLIGKYTSSSKKRLFLAYGLINFFFTNLILQVSLLFLPIFLSTIISQILNLIIGFYFYGKKVFKVEISFKVFKKYLNLASFIWIVNYLSISLLFSFDINKNLAALILLPIVVFISYTFQNKYVFRN